MKWGVAVTATALCTGWLAAFGWPVPLAAVLGALTGFLIGKVWNA